MNFDDAAFVGELHRILDQVHPHLAQQFFIRGNGHRRQLQLPINLPIFPGGGKLYQHFPQLFIQPEDGDSGRHHLLFQTSQPQQGLGHVAQPLTFPGNHVHVFIP